MRTRRHVCTVCVCIHTHTHTHIHTHTHACVYSWIQCSLKSSISSISTCTYIRTQFTKRDWVMHAYIVCFVWECGIRTITHDYACLCVLEYMHVWMCMYRCWYVQMPFSQLHIRSTEILKFMYYVCRSWEWRNRARTWACTYKVNRSLQYMW